jgi:hypothetical protein
MSRSTPRRVRGLRSLLLAAMIVPLLAVTFLAPQVSAYEPDDPVVRAMTDKAVAFLRAYKANSRGGDQMGRIGGRVLRGLAIYKYMDVYSIPGAKNDSIVSAALAESVPWASDPKSLASAELDSCYDLAVVAILLLEVDSSLYRPQIQNILNELANRQTKNGAWTYVNEQDGSHADTSQTQYVVLALWTAQKQGFDLDNEYVASACNWLLRTQHTTGSWGYHGDDPGTFTRKDQSIKLGGKSNFSDAPSDAACGISSLYIAAGMLQFVKNEPPKKQEAKKTLAGGAVKRKEDPEAKGLKPLTNSVPRPVLEQGLRDGDSWFQQNYTMESKGTDWLNSTSPRTRTIRWPYYYLYVFERYNTFKDLAAGIDPKSPKWYNDGVTYLRGKQRDDGSWDMGKGGPMANTSFSVFFLIRSTRKSVAKFNQDTQFQGGKGLPKDVANARLDGARVTGAQVSGDIEAIIAMLEDPNGPSFDSRAELPPELTLDSDTQKRKAQVERLKALVGAKNYKARRIAVRNLARAEGLDAVPLLLYALTDPDESVTREARDALRFLSRRLSGFGLPDKASPEQKALAYDKWLQWYRSVRPEVDLDEVIIKPEAP